MSEMIERGARAIADARSGRRTETARRVRGGPTEISLAVARLDARAVIEVIREPTTEQIDRALHDHPAPPGHAPSKIWLRGFFRAMIGVGLKDGVEGPPSEA